MRTDNNSKMQRLIGLVDRVLAEEAEKKSRALVKASVISANEMGQRPVRDYVDHSARPEAPSVPKTVRHPVFRQEAKRYLQTDGADWLRHYTVCNEVLKEPLAEMGVAEGSEVHERALALLVDDYSYSGKADAKDAQYSVRTAIREKLERELVAQGYTRSEAMALSRTSVRRPEEHRVIVSQNSYRETPQTNDSLTFTVEEVQSFEATED